MLIEEFELLLDLFEDRVPDRESNREVFKMCQEQHNWHKAHAAFQGVRKRNLVAEKNKDSVRESQYSLEEVILKTLYNLIRPTAPFDPDSPYFIIRNALRLAKKLDIPTDRVVEIVV